MEIYQKPLLPQDTALSGFVLLPEAFRRIQEEVFHVREAPEWLLKRWPQESGRYPYAHCVYVERQGDVEVACLSFMTGTVPWGAPGKKQGLAEHFINGKPRGFMDVLFLLDSYLASKRSEHGHGIPRRSLALESGKGNAIKQMLAETHGCLLWDYQLENLLGFFFIRAEERRTLCKGLNSGNAEAWEVVNKVLVEDGMSLGQLIDDRWYGTTMTPSLSGAYVVYQELCEQGRYDHER